MSVYNAEKWVDKSIKSILDQSFKNWEFIIVNDGSSDKTKEILEKYSKADERIKIFNKENTGLTKSLNYGLKRCNGKYIARLDADDLCLPNRLSTQYNFMQQNPEVVLCGSYHYEKNEDINKIRLCKYPKSNKGLKNNLLNVKGFFSHSSSMFLKDSVNDFKGYSQKFKKTQDFDLWLKLSSVGKMACIDQPLVEILKHDNSISKSDKGFDQYSYGVVAASLYFIFKEKNIWLDKTMDEKTWNNMMQYANDIIQKEPYVKGLMLDKKKLAFKPIQLIKNYKYIYHWLIFKLFGSSLPIKLSKKIIKSHKI